MKSTAAKFLIFLIGAAIPERVYGPVGIADGTKPRNNETVERKTRSSRRVGTTVTFRRREPDAKEGNGGEGGGDAHISMA